MEEMEAAMETSTAIQEKWKRPPVPPIDFQTDSVIFQQLDIETYISKAVPGTQLCNIDN